MNSQTRLSAKGQVVIPKDMRDALGWPEGQQLSIVKIGGKAILEPTHTPRKTISYAEFRQKIPKYMGDPVAVEDMTRDIGELFKDWEV